MKNKSALWILILLVIAGVVAYFLFASDSSILQGKFNKVGNLSPETTVQDVVDQGAETAAYVCGNVWRSDEGSTDSDPLTDEEKKRLKDRVATADKMNDANLREETKDAIFDDCETAGGSYNECKDITGCWDPLNPNEYP